MHTTRSYQKMLDLLADLAALGFTAAAGGFLLDRFTLALFAFASGAAILLIAAHDYAPRKNYTCCSTARVDDAAARRRAERMALAA